MKKMRLTPAALLDVAAIVKANLSGWYMLLALLLFSILLSGCDNKEEEIEGCFPFQDCVFEATAVEVVCGYGAFENKWLQINDTLYIQPWVNATPVQHLIVGQKYRFGYVEVERDNSYRDIVTCQAALPKARMVKLTCLEQVVSTGI